MTLRLREQIIIDGYSDNGDDDEDADEDDENNGDGECDGDGDLGGDSGLDVRDGGGHNGGGDGVTPSCAVVIAHVQHVFLLTSHLQLAVVSASAFFLT